MDPERIAIASTGDPEEDQRQIREFIKSDRLITEGLCPNGCGPMKAINGFDLNCGQCGFTQFRNTPHGINP